MIVIVTTCGSSDEAERIASALIAERLAACVQILPVTSIYRWEGKVERAEEYALHIKTRAALADRVEDRVCALHSYRVPELLMLPVAGGSAAYLAWMKTETQE